MNIKIVKLARLAAQIDGIDESIATSSFIQTFSQMLLAQCMLEADKFNEFGDPAQTTLTVGQYIHYRFHTDE